MSTKIVAKVDKKFMGPLDPEMSEFELLQAYSNIARMWEMYLGYEGEDEELPWS